MGILMKFVNLTSRTVRLVYGPSWFPKEILPSGKIASIWDTEEVSRGFFSWDWEGVALPPLRDDTFLIVSSEVRLSLPERWDLLTPRVEGEETHGFWVNQSFIEEFCEETEAPDLEEFYYEEFDEEFDEESNGGSL